jgi:hypothetical protein
MKHLNCGVGGTFGRSDPKPEFLIIDFYGATVVRKINKKKNFDDIIEVI